MCKSFACDILTSNGSFVTTITVVQGYISNADYNGKKTVLVLFINGRPVDCSPLKRALEATYAALLPKAAKPWVFLVGSRELCLA